MRKEVRQAIRDARVRTASPDHKPPRQSVIGAGGRINNDKKQQSVELDSETIFIVKQAKSVLEDYLKGLSEDIKAGKTSRYLESLNQMVRLNESKSFLSQQAAKKLDELIKKINAGVSDGDEEGVRNLIDGILKALLYN